MAGDRAPLKLGDVVTLQRGTTYQSALLGQPGPVLLGLASIQRNGGFRDDNLKTYGGDSPGKLTLHPGDIYVSLKDVTQSADLLGAIARVPLHVAAGRVTQDTVKLTFIRKDIPSRYIYWLLRTPFYREYCRGHAIGTTNLSIAREDFLAFPVPKPEARELSLVEMLDALDNKIELNRRMNATLEAMARALFQSWFVDFDPVRAKLDGRQPIGLDAATAALFPAHFQDSPLGHIPSGWRISSLRTLSSYLSRGIGPTYLEKDGICVLNQKCVRDHRVDFSKSRRHDFAKRPVDGRALQLHDVLVNSTGVGTLGRLAQVFHLHETTIVDSHITIVRANSETDPLFLGLNLIGREVEIEELGEGSTGQTELSRTRLGDLKIITPSSAVQRMFGAVVHPFLLRISENDKQSRALATMRDTLLPKLLSGELSVSGLRAECAAVA